MYTYHGICHSGDAYSIFPDQIRYWLSVIGFYKTKSPTARAVLRDNVHS